MAAKPKPKAPDGLGAEAMRLWKSAVAAFVFMPHELPLLREVVRIVDRLEQLEDEIVDRGVMMVDGKPNPALVEARQQQVVLGRLLVTLRLPESWDEDDRPQRRGGARGPYGSRDLRAVHG